VQGMSSLPEALTDFLKKEELTGDNQYQVTSSASLNVYLVNPLQGYIPGEIQFC